MNQLYDVVYEFNFSLPPDYALVLRALGSLEWTTILLDPDFKVIESAYPFVIGRLLANPNPDMRRILRQLVIQNDGSIRWNRLERLIVAISKQASEYVEDSKSPGESSNPLGWKSFNMRAIVAATKDLWLFILSKKGLRVRISTESSSSGYASKGSSWIPISRSSGEYGPRSVIGHVSSNEKYII